MFSKGTNITRSIPNVKIFLLCQTLFSVKHFIIFNNFNLWGRQNIIAFGPFFLANVFKIDYQFGVFKCFFPKTFFFFQFLLTNLFEFFSFYFILLLLLFFFFWGGGGVKFL